MHNLWSINSKLDWYKNKYARFAPLIDLDFFFEVTTREYARKGRTGENCILSEHTCENGLKMKLIITLYFTRHLLEQRQDGWLLNVTGY